jgi:GR25 family glycosyltransferase involved in LPS biosynthesis
MSKIYGPVVINLDKRTDRLNHISEEMGRLKLDFIRLSATENLTNPAIGCIDSHCRALEDFLKTDNDIAFICEDDAKFRCQRADIDHYLIEFISAPADVLCFGFYAAQMTEYTSLFNKSNDIQNRVSYVVKREAAKELIAIWRKLYILLCTNGHVQNKHNWYFEAYNALPIKNRASDIYRGDQAWKICQQYLNFVLPIKNMVIQMQSYSDIEQKVVFYGH